MAAAHLRAADVAPALLASYTAGYRAGFAAGAAYAEGCSGKLRQSLPEAKAAVSRRRGPGSVYRCPICHAWHSTHFDETNSRAIGRKARRDMGDTE